MKCIASMPQSSARPVLPIFFIVLWTVQLSASQPNYGPPAPMPPMVRHPGTCTFQRSQPACTFSLLCYLAGGVPIEGCGGDVAMTCCMLYNGQHSLLGSGLQQHGPPQHHPHHPHLPPPPPGHLQPAPYPPHHHYPPSQLPPPPPQQLTQQLPPPPPLPQPQTAMVYMPQASQHFTPTTHYADPEDNVVRRTVPATVPPEQTYSEPRNQYARNFQGEDVCGKPSAKPTSRIIGGQDAYFGEFPWQVHIKIAKHQCGGALVNREFVVTAAHCVYQAPLHQLSIIIGAHDIEDHRYQEDPPQYFSVAEVRLHPSFRFSASHPDRYDVAVLRLDKAARYTDNVLPICLPPKGIQFEGWYGVVTGWGKTDPALSNRYGTRLLQKVDVPIIKNDECENWHQTRGIDLQIFPEMMCAGYEDGRKDACVGDSGGPLVVFLNGRWTLAGITSAGFGCAQSRQPGIYHRLPLTVDWVLANIVPR